MSLIRSVEPWNQTDSKRRIFDSFGKSLDPFKNNLTNLNVELEKIKDDTTRISNEISQLN